MPGRRSRKKSADHRKPPLVFEESPINILHNLPSPVYASDHPPTAKTVPANEVNPGWVSPQFPDRPATQTSRARRSRQRSGQRSSTRLRIRHNSGKNGSFNISHRGLPKGMVPLQFIGDRVLRVPSPVDDVSISETEDVPIGNEQVQSKDNRDKVESLGNTSYNNDLNKPSPSVLRKAKQWRCSNLDSVKRLSNLYKVEKSSSLIQSPGLRRSTRLREKLMREIMCSSPLPSQSIPQVLAYDTPEEEYGLTFRKRRHLLIKRMRAYRTDIISDSSGTEAAS